MQDVGHALVLGATGSGKSFLLNFLITHAQKYDAAPRSCSTSGGATGSGDGLLAGAPGPRSEAAVVTSTPSRFRQPPTPALPARVRPCAAARATTGTACSGLTSTSIDEAVTDLYSLERRSVASRPWRSAAARPGGAPEQVDRRSRFRRLFDNVDNALTVEAFQVFDFQGLKRTPVVEALLFYVLHRVVARHEDRRRPDFKLCVIDEAWRFTRPDLERLRRGGPQNVAKAQRRDDSGHADRRGLRLGRSAADHRRGARPSSCWPTRRSTIGTMPTVVERNGT